MNKETCGRIKRATNIKKYANSYQKTEYTEGPCIFFSMYAGFHLVLYNISFQDLHYINIQVEPPFKRKQAIKYCLSFLYLYAYAAVFFSLMVVKQAVTCLSSEFSFRVKTS